MLSAMRCHRHRRYGALVAVLLLAAGPACGEDPPGGLDVYILRHAETVGNATGTYTPAAESQFSEKGRRQIAGIVDSLANHRFDAILVSPTPRTRGTIRPYLEAHGRTAEIWPEFEECRCGHERLAAFEGELPTGEPIVLEADEPALFAFREPGAASHYARGNYAHDLARIRRGCELLEKRFGHSGKSVLIVGHRCAGSRIIETLLGIEPQGRFSLENGQLAHLQQQPDGRFRLVMINGKRFR